MQRKHLGYFFLFVAGLWGGTEIVSMIRQSDTDQFNESLKSRIEIKAENFTLNDTEGKQHQFSEWDGMLRVVNFWATWCPPCRKETPLFVELQEQYSQQGLQFIGIAIDDKEKVLEFMDTYGINYPMLIGEDDAIDVAKRYGNRFGALPYTVIINRGGKVVHAQAGELTRTKAMSILQPML